jgi:hypothetical protein
MVMVKEEERGEVKEMVKDGGDCTHFCTAPLFHFPKGL